MQAPTPPCILLCFPRNLRTLSGGRIPDGTKSLLRRDWRLLYRGRARRQRFAGKGAGRDCAARAARETMCTLGLHASQHRQRSCAEGSLANAPTPALRSVRVGSAAAGTAGPYPYTRKGSVQRRGCAIYDASNRRGTTTPRNEVVLIRGICSNSSMEPVGPSAMPPLYMTQRLRATK